MYIDLNLVGIDTYRYMYNGRYMYTFRSYMYTYLKVSIDPCVPAAHQPTTGTIVRIWYKNVTN